MSQSGIGSALPQIYNSVALNVTLALDALGENKAVLVRTALSEGTRSNAVFSNCAATAEMLDLGQQKRKSNVSLILCLVL
jgi:hypothetical protein